MFVSIYWSVFIEMKRETYRLSKYISYEDFMSLLEPIFNIGYEQQKNKTDLFVDLICNAICRKNDVSYDMIKRITYHSRLYSQRIGEFHENLIAKLGENIGQERLNGLNDKYDVVNYNKKFVAEIQNNDHTKNGDAKRYIINKLHIAQSLGFDSFLVIINRSMPYKKLPNGVKVVNGHLHYQ